MPVKILNSRSALIKELASHRQMSVSNYQHTDNETPPAILRFVMRAFSQHVSTQLWVYPRESRQFLYHIHGFRSF